MLIYYILSAAAILLGLYEAMAFFISRHQCSAVADAVVTELKAGPKGVDCPIYTVDYKGEKLIITQNTVLADRSIKFYAGRQDKIRFDPINPEHNMIEHGLRPVVFSLMTVLLGAAVIVLGITGIFNF